MNNRYGSVAIRAVKLAQGGMDPVQAWKKSAEEEFPSQPSSRVPSSRVKGCPKSAFLGLAEDGLIRGVPRGNYTNSCSSKRYAVEAVKLLRTSPCLEKNKTELWNRVTHNQPKARNQQMDVVLALWKAGLISPSGNQ